MSQAKGWLQGSRPRISTKTPVGEKIHQKVYDSSSIELTIVSFQDSNGEMIELDEKLSLGICNIRDDYIELKNIPEFLSDTSIRSTELIVYNIHRILTSSGNVAHSFEESQTNDEDSNQIITEDQEPKTEKYDGRETTREILESITADVVDNLGYKVQTNVYKEDRQKDKSIEMDVWAENAKTNFSIYVSCKNWDSKLGRQGVDEEVGRVTTLSKIPQLRVLVVAELTDNARSAIEANGFLAITLGEKADEQNADEIYKIINKEFRDTLLAIAPPETEKIANRAKEISNEIEGLAEDIDNLGSLQKE